MGFKMKGYRGFHGNKKSALKDVEIKNLLNEADSDYGVEPETGPQSDYSNRRDYYDWSRIDNPIDEETGDWTGRGTTMDYGQRGLGGDKKGKGYNIDYKEYDPSSPRKTGGVDISIDPEMYDHFDFEHAKQLSQDEFDGMGDKGKVNAILKEYMRQKQTETKGNKPMDIKFGQSEYSGPKWSKKGDKYSPSWSKAMGKDSMMIDDAARKYGVSTKEFYDLAGTGYDEALVNFVDKYTDIYDAELEPYVDVDPGDIGGGGGGGSSRGATPISVDPVSVDKIPTDTVDPVIKKLKTIEPIWNPTSRADLINQLKDAPQFSEERNRIYDQLNWARDHTTTNMDDIKVNSTKTTDVLGNLNKKKGTTTTGTENNTKTETETKPILVKLPKDRDLAGKFTKGSKKRKKKLFKGGEGKGKGGGGFDLSNFSVGDIGAGLKDALDSVFGGI
tara:strand:+ start:285 stop:1616 length:1332 start_codon:yes stop_codon:yes gene_type:complete